MKNVLRSFHLLVCAGLVGSGFGVAGGQGTGAVAPKVPGAETYALEPLVIEKATLKYHMAADGTGFRERTVVARVQAESTLKQLGVLSIPFAANSEHVQWVYARVRHGDGTVTETPVDTAIEMADAVTREAPFYSDLKQMQLPLRNLRVGDTLEWQAKVVGSLELTQIRILGGVDGLNAGSVDLDIGGHNCYVAPATAQKQPSFFQRVTYHACGLR